MNLWLCVRFHHSAGHTCYMLLNALVWQPRKCVVCITRGSVLFHTFPMYMAQNFICTTTDNASLDTVIAARRIKFLQSLQNVHGQHPVPHYLYARSWALLVENSWLKCDFCLIFYCLCCMFWSVFFFYFIFSLLWYKYCLSAALWRIDIIFVVVLRQCLISHALCTSACYILLYCTIVDVENGWPAAMGIRPFWQASLIYMLKCFSLYLLISLFGLVFRWVQRNNNA